MEILGYLASALIGISLGLTGGGGAILTVPVLVYLFSVAPVSAFTYSLFIVGASSLAGIIPKYKQGSLDMKTALLFGAPSIVTVFITRKFILPRIPEILFQNGHFTITRSLLLMLLFAALMLFAAIAILRKEQPVSTLKDERHFQPGILLQGAIVGVITGLVGAGGGFLIIPSLMLLRKLSIQQAAGTSLLIIAVNSLIGFAVAQPDQVIDWRLLGIVTLLAVAGIFIGNYLSLQIDSGKLKKGFGAFVLAMGIYIIIREVTFILSY